MEIESISRSQLQGLCCVCASQLLVMVFEQRWICFHARPASPARGKHVSVKSILCFSKINFVLGNVDFVIRLS